MTMPLRNRVKPSQRRSATNPNHRRRPAIEQLEPRLVLSTITWNGAGDGTSFAQGANWVGGVIPGSTDDAVINLNSKPTTTIRFPTNGNVTVNSLTQTNGTLADDGATVFTTTGLTLNGGTFTDAGGTFTLPSAGAGPVSFVNSTINLPSNKGSGLFLAQGADTLNGTIATSQTIQAQGNNNIGDANLTLANLSGNNGTILLQSAQGSGYRSNVAVASGSTFTNTGNFTVNASNSASNLTGSFDNKGTFTVNGGATIIVGSSNLSFTQDAGTLGGSGLFYCTAGTLQVNGGSIPTNSSVIAYGSQLNIASSFTTTATIYANGSSTLTGNAGPATTVLVQGNNNIGDSNLTLAAGATNLGTILLQSASGSGYRSNVIVASGSTFTNAGTFQVNASNSASNLTGSFDNKGTFTVNGTLYVGTSNLSFTQDAGSLSATGVFYCTAGTLQINGGSISGNVEAYGCQLAIASSFTNAALVYAVGSTTLLNNAGPLMTVQVQGNNNIGDSNLTLAAGATNAGTILLQSAQGSGYRSNVAVASGSTFTNTGNFTINASNNASNLTGSFDNKGTFTVNGTLYVGTSNLSFTQDAGTLGGTGYFYCTAGTFQINGGSIPNNPNNIPPYIAADGCQLAIASSFTNAALVYAVGSTTLLNNAGPLMTVQVQGNNNIGDSNLTLAAGATNAGTILLQSAQGSGYRSNVAVASGSTFTNTGNFTINASNNASNLTGSFDNKGTFTVNGTLYVGTSNLSFTQDAGSLSATGVFYCTAGTFQINGGSISGNVEADGCQLAIASSFTNAALVYAVGSTTLLNNAGPQMTVQVQGNNNIGEADLTLAAGATNLGTILLQSASGSGYRSNVIVASGSTFNNAGTFQVNSSVNSSTLTGSLVNQGHFNIVGASLVSNGTGASLVNLAGGVVNASGTLDDSATSFTNYGTFIVGTGAASLKIIGPYTQTSTQTSTAALDIEVGGLTAGTQFDQLNITGPATLDGALNVSTLNSYLPSIGSSFKIITYASASGSFAAYNGINLSNGVTLSPTQSATNLTLNAIATPLADLSVTVMTDKNPPVYSLGANITYLVTVRNLGPSDDTNVVLLDTLPGNVTLVSDVASKGTVTSSNGVLTNTIGTLPSGSTATLSVVVTPLAAGSYTDIASVTGALVDPSTTNNSASATATVVVPTADLGVTMGPNQTVTLGSNITYVVTETNHGPFTDTNVVLTDNLPAGTTLVTASANGGVVTEGVSVVTDTVGSLASGDSIQLTVTVSPSPAVPGFYTDSASVAGDLADPVATNNTVSSVATVINPQSDLAVAIATVPASGVYPAGANVLYKVTVKNTGPNDDTNVVVTDTLPTNASFILATGTIGTVTTIPGGVTDTVATLVSGATETLTITVNPLAPGSFLDQATATGANTDPNAANNTASATATVNQILAPTSLSLEAASDSGWSPSDDFTNVTSPVFDVVANDPTATVKLLRATSAMGTYIIVASTAGASGTVRLTDLNLAGLAQAGPINQTFYYEAEQVNSVGTASSPSNVLPVTIDNVTPAIPAPMTLDPSTNTGSGSAPYYTSNGNPLFDLGGVVTTGQLTLLRSTGGGPAVVVGTGAIGGSQVRDSQVVLTNGTYYYQVYQTDQAGNISPTGMPLAVTILPNGPLEPTLAILPADDSGAPANPSFTNVRAPHFTGVTSPGLRVDLLSKPAGIVFGTTVANPDGSFAVQLSGPVGDGTYTLVARTTDQAGNQSLGAPLVLTIKATPPHIAPTLTLLPADDTGVKGDGVTAAIRPGSPGSPTPTPRSSFIPSWPMAPINTWGTPRRPPPAVSRSSLPIP